MKKIGFGIGALALIILFIVYYLGETEKKETIELNVLQERVTQQLTQMQNNGFTITDRKMQQEQEHFFITITDPQKASAYLTQLGLRATPQEAKELKDIKFSTELQYLSDLYSLDIYPVTLPPYLKTVIANTHEADILTQIEALIEKKVFFMHLDIDHSGTTFKGNVKDIDESLQGEKTAAMKLQGFNFSGNIKEQKIVKFKQSFNHAHLYISNEVNNTILGLQSSYELTGPTMYDYTSRYAIDQVKSSEEPGSTLMAESLLVDSTSKVENGLAKETLKATVKSAEILYEKEKVGFKNLLLDMNMSNIDIAALDTLQEMETKKQKEVDDVIETFVSKNMHLTLSNLSAEKMVLRGKEVGGFTLNADLDIDHSLDIYRMNIQHKHALNKMDGDINLSISKEILTMLKEDPEFMIIYMMYRPKRKLGQRLYHIKIGDGEIKINGKAVDF